jgi:hypothetical protein
MKRFKLCCMFFIVALVGLGDLDPSRAQTTIVIPLRPQLTSGTVQDKTYQNDSLGLQFTPPPGLKFGAPELKGKSGAPPSLVTIATGSEANGAAVFYAEDLGYYAQDRRSTKAYTERVIRSQKEQGLDLVEAETEGRLGGVTFARIDFHQALSYEVVLVKACDVYAFVFIFAASDVESANKLIGETTVKLDLQKSGCGSATPDTPHKK